MALTVMLPSCPGATRPPTHRGGWLRTAIRSDRIRPLPTLPKQCSSPRHAARRTRLAGQPSPHPSCRWCGPCGSGSGRRHTGPSWRARGHGGRRRTQMSCRPPIRRPAVLIAWRRPAVAGRALVDSGGIRQRRRAVERVTLRACIGVNHDLPQIPGGNFRRSADTHGQSYSWVPQISSRGQWRSSRGPRHGRIATWRWRWFSSASPSGLMP